MSDAQASPYRMRSVRVVLAFLVLLSTVVLIPGAPSAEAAADDLWVTKSVDSNAIFHGATSNWTITVDTSADVTLADSIVVTDTLPDGLCPQGAGDADCPGGVAPVPAYTSAVENANGTWTLIWNLADMGPSTQVAITYTTVTRTHYQESFADDTPIVARDAWVNTAQVDGNVDGTPVVDVSTVSQVATGVTIAKDVASRPASLPQPAVCDDGSGLTWVAGNATGYRVGDQICWRLSVDYPANLYTLDSVVSDAVPSGQSFTANDTWALGAGNTVPVGDVDGSGNLPTVGTLSWDIGDAGGYVGSGLRFEVVYSTTVVDPSATSSGQIVTNVMNHTHNPTTGGGIGAADVAGAEINEAELSIVKGVSAVNTISTGGPHVDGVEVSESDVITYQVSVTNSGDVDATNVEVWDVLPALFATCSTNVSAISDGGVCVDGSNRIEWVGASTLSVAAGATTTVSYDVTLPSGIAPAITMGNTAGVRSYATATNTDSGSFTYVPLSNIDPAATGQNTTAARDTSSVVTSAATLGHARTTGVDESGNHADTQATIGELVTYTITVHIPEGTTVYDADVFDDLPTNLDLVTSSHTFDGEEVVTRTEDAGADSVTVEFPDPSYRNAPGTGDDTLTLTVVGRVIDIPANTRNTTITNTAAFSWLDQDSAPHSLSSGVNTTVVEPLIGIGKTSVDSIGDNGVVVGDEIVDYTVSVTNSGTSNVSTGHDLVIVDTLPEGMTLTLPVPDGGVWAPDGTPGDGIGGTITWNVSSLGAGAGISRTYQVTVDDPVVVNSTFINNVTADTTSMAGTPTVERSAGTGYHAEVGHILSTPLASLSSSVSPTGPTIGDVVTYTAEVRMPPGTIMYDATVIDTLGAGLIFDRLASVSCDMGGAACDPVIGATEIGVAGTTTAAFFLGDIDVSSSTGEERVVTIEYEAHVTDILNAGDTSPNSVSVYGNQSDLIVGVPGTPPAPGGFDVAVGPASAPITVKEPSLSLDKDVSGQAGDSDARRAVPGEVLTYTITVSNSGGSTVSAAYDIVIVDTVPEGLAVTMPIADGGVWVADGVPGNGVAGTITWNYAGPLATGASLVRSYDATVDAALDSGDENPAGPELLNTADVPSYFGVSSGDRAANPGFTFREYNDVTADQVAIELDLASVGSVVWFDIDADGVQEAGEPPFSGVDVIVTYLGADGVVSGDDEAHIVATAADGSYLVEHLPGGNYTVVVDLADLPAGFVPSYDLDDGTLTPDGTWGPGALGQDEDKLNVDFGFTGTGSIGDLVWFDSDADQSLGGSEYGLEGIDVTVTWLGVDGVLSGDDVVYPAVTDAAGNYLVPRLPAGLYTIVIDGLSLPAGMQPTYDSNGIGTPGATAVVLGSGEDNSSQDFGYAGTGALGDRVWLDRDGDGFQDAGESGLVDVPIQLTWPGEDGVLGGGDDELFLTTTAPGGLYFIPNLPPGEYIVEVLGGLPGATTNTFDEDGGGDARTQVNLTDGESHLTTDFGFHGTASIGDTVWWDQDGNGAQDAGEPGISGVTMELTFAGIDGVFGNADDLVFTATTDDGGGFLFTDLPAGSYEVLVSGGLPAGVVATFDEDGG
ncbi:MAG: SdrD B-like domain-containing protein, partial [Acidimicrobiia bacterium]|nr:SdrD B-like domain-containing protein [Acidimicrobiia bacterium]